MTITINREKFAFACAAIGGIAKKEGISPAANMAFLSCHSGDTLTIKGTDMENWLSLEVPAKGDMAAIQVDAFKLAELVAKLIGDEVKADVKDGSLHLTAGKSKRKLAGQVTNYPEVPTPSGWGGAVDIDALRDAVAFVGPSIAGVEKPMFNGVRLQGSNAVAYNGAGLAAAGIDGLEIEGVTIAPSTLKLLKWLPDDGAVQFIIGERLLALEWANGRLIASKMEGDWPFLRDGVETVLPQHDHALIVHPSDLMASINAVKAVAADDKASGSKVVTLALSGDECMVSVASGAGTADEPLDAEWGGPDLRVNMSVTRLAAIISGFAQDMPVTIGITPLPDIGAEKAKGCVIRQDAKPGCVGMLAQIR